MVTIEWLEEASYMQFKGNINGIKRVPMFKSDGHCPSLRFDLSYLDKSQNLQSMSAEQFKYFLRQFRKEIEEQDYSDFVLETAFAFVERKEPLTKNLFSVYKALNDLSLKMPELKRTDIEVSPHFEIYSHPR